MREIKFRGMVIDHHKRNGEFVYGCYRDIYPDDYPPEITEWQEEQQYYATYKVDIRTVGQYIGLKDKNNTYIYEYDIVKDIRGNIGYVSFLQQEMGYVIVYENHDKRIGHRTTGCWYEQDYNIEIIGNIFKNRDSISWLNQ